MNKFIKKYHHLPVTVKVTMWFMVCSIIQKAISVITVPIFTRILSTQEYGTFSIYNSWLQVFTIVTAFRLDYAVFNKGMSKYPKDRDRYTSSMQGLTATLTTIVLIVYLIFRKQVNQMTELSTFVTLAMITELYFTPAISFWTLRLRYDFKYKAVILVTLAMALLNPVVGLIAVNLSKHKDIARIMSCILIQICFGVYIFMLNLRKGKKLCVFKYWKFALLFNIPLIPHYFSAYILDQSDRIVIQKLCGMNQVALYSVAYNAGSIIKIATNSLNNAIIPWQYRKLEKNEIIDLKNLILKVSLLVSFFCILFSILAPELMFFFASKEYQETIYVIPPVAASVFFIFIYGIYANIEFYYNANKFTSVISLGGAVLNVFLNFIFIRKYGYIAAGYTTLACYIIFTLLHYMYARLIVKRKLRVDIFDKRIVLICISIVILTIIVSFTYKIKWIHYGSIIVFLLYLWCNKKKIKNILLKSLKRKQ